MRVQVLLNDCADRRVRRHGNLASPDERDAVRRRKCRKWGTAAHIGQNRSRPCTSGGTLFRTSLASLQNPWCGQMAPAAPRVLQS